MGARKLHIIVFRVYTSREWVLGFSLGRHPLESEDGGKRYT